MTFCYISSNLNKFRYAKIERVHQNDYVGLHGKENEFSFNTVMMKKTYLLKKNLFFRDV